LGGKRDMYCKTCGTQNPDTALYCSKDGAALQTLPLAYLVKEESKYCSICGTLNDGLGNYCTHCGASLLKIDTKKASMVIPSGKSLPKVNVGKLDFSPSRLKAALIGFLITVILLIGLSFGLNSYFGEELFSKMGDMSEEILSDLPNNPLEKDLISTALLSNIIGSELKISGDGEYLSLGIKIGLILLLIIPLLSLFFGGNVMAKRNSDTDFSGHLSGSILIGIMYGVFLAVLTQFAGTTEEYGYATISFKFSFFGALVQGFVVGTIFSLLGSLVVSNQGQRLGNYPYISPIFRGIYIPFVGVLFSSIIYFTILFIKYGAEVFDEMLILLVVVTQAGAYLWFIGNFLSVKGELMSYYDEVSFKVSLIGDAKGNFELVEALKEVEGYKWLFLLLPLILLFLAGRRLRNGIQDIAIFAVSFAAMMTFIAYITRISFDISGSPEAMEFFDGNGIHIGVGILNTFLVTLIIAAVLAFLGQKFLGKSTD
jgi:hypothetical protein